MIGVEKNIVHEADKDQGGWKYQAKVAPVGEVGVQHGGEYPGDPRAAEMVVDDTTAQYMTGTPREYMTREVK